MTDRENLEYLVFLCLCSSMISDKMACKLLNINTEDLDTWFIEYDIRKFKDCDIKNSIETKAMEIIG